MKISIILLMLVAAGRTWGQTESVDQSFQFKSPRWANEKLVLEPAEKPNEAVGRTVIYNGILVQAVKMNNPLQLVNPLAAPEFGDGEDNLLRDPITSKEIGLKFFSISY